IADGTDSKTVALSAADLATGRFTYQRKTGDIEVRLNVQMANGSSVTEASRYLGRPPANVEKAQDSKGLEDQKAQLEAQVKQLQGQNAAQAERIQQLERTL